MEGITVLSLFDGVSCGHVALDRAGIPIKKYYASEIDKYATQITQKNYPQTIQLGDVEKVDFKQFEGQIDLLIGGSPCTNLSICGNRKGLEGDESRLFWEYVRAIKECKPKYFLLENVESMFNSDKEIISKELGCYPIMINSALLSAQNRKRYYWFNWGNQSRNLVGFPTCAIPQPKNKHILLKDILEEDGMAELPQKDNINGNIRCGEFGHGGQGERLYHSYGKSVCLGLGGSIKENYAIPILEDKPNQVIYTIKNGTISTTLNGENIDINKYRIELPDGKYLIRKLKPIECERLQTLPDNYTAYGIDESGNEVKISNTQRYNVCGNGWTVDVISHIFLYLPIKLCV